MASTRSCRTKHTDSGEEPLRKHGKPRAKREAFFRGQGSWARATPGKGADWLTGSAATPMAHHTDNDEAVKVARYLVHKYEPENPEALSGALRLYLLGRLGSEAKQLMWDDESGEFLDVDGLRGLARGLARELAQQLPSSPPDASPSASERAIGRSFGMSPYMTYDEVFGDPCWDRV